MHRALYWKGETREEVWFGSAMGRSEVFDFVRKSAFTEHLLRVNYGPKERRIKFDASRFLME